MRFWVMGRSSCVLNRTQIIDFFKGEYKEMNIKEVKSKVMTGIGMFVTVLGAAFEGGALLAHLQGIVIQIVPLAVTGMICIIAGIVCMVTGRRKRVRK